MASESSLAAAAVATAMENMCPRLTVDWTERTFDKNLSWNWPRPFRSRRG